ncbi:unnamed protein product [Dovyalis caffra]|uniref:PGG domain-containing protein n=1 Tax=Dovyalis caffra TaxID=77055 RepID=A0AAV1SQ23_9ROSI|nr:unnamed protein product [Dovyalis caffra]
MEGREVEGSFSGANGVRNIQLRKRCKDGPSGGARPLSPVLDVEGKPLISGVEYYILPAETDITGDCRLSSRCVSAGIVDENGKKLLVLGGPAFPFKEILDSLADFGSGPRGRIVVDKKKDVTAIEKGREANLITAVLISTVTFAAAFTLPGGYKNEQGPNQGTAILSKKAAFVAFVISDAMSMVLSLSAVFIHFSMSPFRPSARNYFKAASLLTQFSMATMVIAFVTGTYAVLAPSLVLAITTSLIGIGRTQFRSWD